MKVSVYWNLHKHCFSVRNSLGKVIKHVDRLNLKNVKFRVQKAGQKRTREEQRKRVHAFVCGEIDKPSTIRGRRVTYNPYKHNTFVFIDDNSPALDALRVGLSINGTKPVVCCEDNKNA